MISSDDTQRQYSLFLSKLLLLLLSSQLKNCLKADKFAINADWWDINAQWWDTSFHKIADSPDDSLFDAALRHRDILVANLWRTLSVTQHHLQFCTNKSHPHIWPLLSSTDVSQSVFIPLFTASVPIYQACWSCQYGGVRRWRLNLRRTGPYVTDPRKQLNQDFGTNMLLKKKLGIIFKLAMSPIIPQCTLKIIVIHNRPPF